ncbi:MAG: carboxyl-terminal processing protease [Chloroflexota bacterium]|jgi:carboxyl-terminal processing protease|nr:carboxyl-terminal processing protease [Chloroflexota bacterium]
MAPTRARGRWLKRVVIVLLLPVSFYLGMVFEFHAGPDIDQVIAPALFAAPVKSLDLGTLNQVFELMQRNYAKKDLNSNDAFNAAAKGLVHNLLGSPQYKDDFSFYFTPEELRQNKEFLAGSFGGIGASMEVKNTQLTVTAITPSSPAQAADLRAGDVVTRIDGQDAAGLTVDQAVQKIRGKVNTHVKLTVSRAGKILEFDIVRAQISVPSVRSKDIAPGVFYIRVYEFGEHSADDFDKQLRDAVARGDNKVIFDLRRDPGGFVSAADRIVSEFVRSGVTVKVVDRSTTDEHKVTGQGVAFDTRVVVLVDENSASASEITAGALQDHQRATLVGKKTFGKGLVEQDFPLRNGGDLHLTVAYWYRPSGKSINLVGITPDTTVALASPQDFYEVADPAANAAKDAQLQAALAALK